MEMYPDRVFSKPEFTQLPPYLFSGADFALIPSRDEPFGLVAVEFGRKGALGVGSRLGGLGLMPGWVCYVSLHISIFADSVSQWFPVESSSTGHMLSQLTKTIKMALKSTEEERAMLRARSAVQRFPVVEWRQRMEDFHRRSITTSRSVAGAEAWRPSDGRVAYSDNVEGMQVEFWDPETASIRSHQATRIPDDPFAPGPFNPDASAVPDTLMPPSIRPRRESFNTDVSDEDYFTSRHGHEEQPQNFGNFLNKVNRQVARDQRHVGDPFLNANEASLSRPFGAHSRVSSVESIASIVDEKADSPLNKAIATVYSIFVH